MATTGGEHVLGFPFGSPQTPEDHFVQFVAGQLLEGRSVVLPDITAESGRRIISTLDLEALGHIRRSFQQSQPSPQA